MRTRYCEDITAGETHEFGDYQMRKSEIIEFAEQWDTLDFHTDEEAATDSAFGELVASGIHTLAVTQRLVSRNFLQELAALGGPELESVKFLQPVRPGDRLRTQLEVRSKRVSESKPDRGLVTYDLTTKTEDGEAVLTVTVVTFVRRRAHEENPS